MSIKQGPTVNGFGPATITPPGPGWSISFSRGIISQMNEVTRCLSAIDKGEPGAAEKFLPLVYDELRKLAANRMALESPGHTLNATALVHEAYLRLLGNQQFANRGHFFAAAAEAMRRIMVNHARDRNRLKRGGDRKRVSFDQVTELAATSDDDLLGLDEALEKLEREYPEPAGLVKLRFFAGMTLEEAASALGISYRTAHRQWVFARAWLFSKLAEN